MRICCVEDCDVADSDDITYFTFPIKPALRKKWRAAIRSSEKLHDDSKVCEKHFRQTDYEWVRGKLRLKSGVVPCVFASDKAVTEPTVPPQTSPEHNNASCDPESLPEGPGPLLEGPLLEPPDYMMTLADLCMQQQYEPEAPENCTIECVPEAVLDHESDSHSETDLHKEDIENIIANYHIKPNKELAERLKASEALDNEKQKEYLLNKENNQTNTQNGDTNVANGGSTGNSDKSGVNSDKSVGNSDKSVGNSDKSVRKVTQSARIGSESRSVRSSQDSDCILTDPPKPHFVEISVDKGDKDADDCMMLLESVQCDVDPSSLLGGYQPLLAVEPKKEEAISLLTSSDSDDVILQEPHIDTVEVSSSDSDSKPLVCLATGKMRRLYPCYECKFTTYSSHQYRKHRLQKHIRPQNTLVCSCGAEVGSKLELKRHEKSHRKIRCKICSFKARHTSALVYHMTSHGVDMETVQFADGSVMIRDSKKRISRKTKRRRGFHCKDCSFVCDHKRDLEEHIEEEHCV